MLAELVARFTAAHPGIRVELLEGSSTEMSRAALEGRGTLGRGIEPDIYIPWTPEECFTDVIMARALAYLRGK